MRGLALLPIPFLREFIRKGIGVKRSTGDIDPCAGIPVPPPGTANAPSAVESTYRETLFAQVLNSIEAAKSGANYDDI